MQIALPVSKKAILMRGDIRGEWISRYQKGDFISIEADTKDKVDRLFNELSTKRYVTIAVNKLFGVPFLECLLINLVFN